MSSLADKKTQDSEHFIIYKEIFTSSRDDLNHISDLLGDVPVGTIVMMMGLPASGKTTVAHYLSKKLNFAVISTDLIRKQIFSFQDLFDKEKVGKLSQREYIYDLMIEHGAYLIRVLQSGSIDSFDIEEHFHSFKVYEIHRNISLNLDNDVSEYRGVIFDATFIVRRFREKVYGLVKKFGVPLVILHVLCSDEVAVKRINNRSKENYESTALRPEIYFENKRLFEPIDWEELKTSFSGFYFKIDTSNTHPFK